MYVNGIFAGKNEKKYWNLPNPEWIRCATSGRSDRLEISIGDLRLYDRDLSAAEVKALYEFEKANDNNTSSSSSKTSANQPVTPTSTSVIGLAVEAAVRKKVNKTKGVLTQSDYNKLERLDLDGMGLREIKGLPNLEELKFLRVVGNRLKQIGQIEELTNLTELNLINCQISDTKGLEKLTKLKWLGLSENKLTNLKNLEKLTQLEFLYVAHNPNLPFSEIVRIQKLLPKCQIKHNATE